MEKIEEIYKPIGEQIRILRQEKGFETLTKFNKYLEELSYNFSYSMLQNIEKGTRRITLEHIIAISEVLGVPIADILKPLDIHRVRGLDMLEDSIVGDITTPGNDLHAVVIGDINIDLVCESAGLTEFLRNIEQERKSWHFHGKYNTEFGGVGVLFAFKALAAGFEKASLIGKIGGSSPEAYDPFGQYVMTELKDAGINTKHVTVSSAQTGTAILFREKINGGADKLLTFTAKPTANQKLMASDVDAAREIIANADVVHISGYCFDERKEASRQLIELGSNFDVPVALDIVDEMYPLDRRPPLLPEEELKEVISKTEIIIGEEPTLLALVKSSQPVKNDPLKAQLLSSLHQFCEILIIRDGETRLLDESLTQNEEHLYDSQILSVEYNREIQYVRAPTGYSESALEERRGYGDRLTTAILFHLLSPKALVITSFPIKEHLLKSDILRRKFHFLQRSIDGDPPSSTEPKTLEDVHEWLRNIINKQINETKNIIGENRRQFRNVEVIFALENAIFLKNSDNETGLLLQRPVDEESAKKILKVLNDKKHLFINCIGVYNLRSNREEDVEVVDTEVKLKKLNELEIEEYVKQERFKDMPCGYGLDLIQGSVNLDNIRGIPRDPLINYFSDRLKISDALSRREDIVHEAYSLVEKIKQEMEINKEWNWGLLEPEKSSENQEEE